MYWERKREYEYEIHWIILLNISEYTYNVRASHMIQITLRLKFHEDKKTKQFVNKLIILNFTYWLKHKNGPTAIL